MLLGDFFGGEDFSSKFVYCTILFFLPRPEPYIIWRKDGEKIEDGDDGFYLPAEHFNRLLVIKKVTKREHQGNYTCTAYSSSGSFDLASVATFLSVKGSKINILQKALFIICLHFCFVIKGWESFSR